MSRSFFAIFSSKEWYTNEISSCDRVSNDWCFRRAFERIYETNSCQVYISREPRTKSHSSIVVLLLFLLFLHRKGRIETFGMKQSSTKIVILDTVVPPSVQIQPVHPPQARRSTASLWKGIHKHTPFPHRGPIKVFFPVYRWRCVRRMIVKQRVAGVHRVANGRNERDTRVSRAIPRPDREGSGKTRPHSDDSITVDDRRGCSIVLCAVYGLDIALWLFTGLLCFIARPRTPPRPPPRSVDDGRVQGVEPCSFVDCYVAGLCNRELYFTVSQNYLFEQDKRSASGLVHVKIL